MSVINRSPVNTASGTGYRYWQDEDFTRFEARLLNEGVDMNTSATALEVTEKGAGADMSVDVATGYALVEITRNARTFKVWVENTATANLAINSNASGATRYDLVCVKVDTTLDPDTQADNMCSLIIVEGTGGAGVPATPSNHLKLAEVEVINGAVTIPDAKIVDTRIAIPNPIDNQKPAHKWLPMEMTHSFMETGKSISGAGNFLERTTYTLHYVHGGAGNEYCNFKESIVAGRSGSGFTGTYAEDVEFFICICPSGETTAIGGHIAYYGTGDFTEAAVVPASHTSTIAHIGFFIDGLTIYASNADGAAQTITSLGTFTAGDVFSLRFVFESGTDIKIYKNETLVATHITNLPDSGDNLCLFYGATNVTAGGGVADINTIIYESDWLRIKAGGGA